MAYCTSGSGFDSHDYQYPNGYPDTSIKWFTKIEWQWQSITSFKFTTKLILF